MYENEITEVIHVQKHALGIKGKISKVLIKSLGSGENNYSILVRVNNQRMVFRINKNKRLEKNLYKEYVHLKNIPKGFAPTPIFFDNTRKIIPHEYSVLSYTPGKLINNWTRRELKLHATELARLHKKKFTKWGNGVKKLKIFDLHAKFIRNYNQFPSMKSDPVIRIVFPKVSDYIKKNNHYFTKLKTFSLIHGDCCADNILFDKNKIRYIDWEWSSIGDNAEDVARVYCSTMQIKPWYIKVNKSDLQYFTSEYIKINPDKTLKQRVDIWNASLLFIELMYFKWKIQNYSKSASTLPKSTYVLAVKKLEKYFIRNFVR